MTDDSFMANFDVIEFRPVEQSLILYPHGRKMLDCKTFFPLSVKIYFVNKHIDILKWLVIVVSSSQPLSLSHVTLDEPCQVVFFF